MRTPAGFECRYFYADYHRGHNKQDCRLIERSPTGERWTADICKNCPVPKITLANACPHLVLEARITKTWAGFGRKVLVSALCTKSLQDVPEPQVGCGHCHEIELQVGSDE
jgi:hypothetical protein